MKIKQIIPAPYKLMVLFNEWEDTEGGPYLVGNTQYVMAYALMDNGEVLPLVEDVEGDLQPVSKDMFIRTWFEGCGND
jgi:hypothetical protein